MRSPARSRLLGRLDPRKKIEREYWNSIRRVTDRLEELIADAESPGEIIRLLRAATNDPWFVRYAEAEATRIVGRISGNDGWTWREDQGRGRRSRLIYEALKREIEGPLKGAFHSEVHRNAEAIRSVPTDVARQFTEHIATRAVEGLRSSEIAKELQKLYPHTTEVKARLIARTETSKTHTAIERARDEQLGVGWYVWRTSEDQRVRKSHASMAGVLVAWRDPPSPEELVGERSAGHYAPGGIYNCRCAPIGLLELDDVEWPCKVYRSGSITRLTRAQFQEIWTPSVVAQRLSG
jgi:SPP1 gp7 family putative phage head morphogenesis protein